MCKRSQQTRHEIEIISGYYLYELHEVVKAVGVDLVRVGSLVRRRPGGRAVALHDDIWGEGGRLLYGRVVCRM